VKLYLSSFEFGDAVDRLRAMADGRRIGFVPNALDHVAAEPRAASNRLRLGELRALGIEADTLDLTEFFGAEARLAETLAGFDGLWVRGGSAFVLRKAMRLSGLDILLRSVPGDFLYAGYSAGVCVLGPNLRGLEGVDPPDAIPYDDDDVVWEGLGILEYLVLPHFESDHPESALIGEAVRRCRREGIPHRTLRDGEVLVFDDAP
jgi:dipeptidase E